MKAAHFLQGLGTDSVIDMEHSDGLLLENVTKPDEKVEPMSAGTRETTEDHAEDLHGGHNRGGCGDYGDRDVVDDGTRMHCIHEFPTHLGVVLKDDPLGDSSDTASTIFHCPLMAVKVLTFGRLDSYPQGPLHLMCRTFRKTNSLEYDCPIDRDRTGIYCDFWVTNWDGVAYRKHGGIFAQDMIEIVAWSSDMSFALRTSQLGCSLILFQSIRGEDNFKRALLYFKNELSIPVRYEKMANSQTLTEVDAALSKELSTLGLQAT